MQTNIHPAARRIVWLVIAIGILAVLIAGIYLLFNLGPGITLPFTKSALDAGWLFLFGLIWLVVGLVLFWWLRTPNGDSDAVQRSEGQLTEFRTAQETRLAEIDTRLKGIESQLVTVNNLSLRLNALEKTFQETNARIDMSGSQGTRLDDVEKKLQSLNTAVPAAPSPTGDSTALEGRLHELDSELTSLGTTIHDAHNRLDALGDVNSHMDTLESQLEALYVTLQDVHRRIDDLEHASKDG